MWLITNHLQFVGRKYILNDTLQVGEIIEECPPTQGQAETLRYRNTNNTTELGQTLKTSLLLSVVRAVTYNHVTTPKP